MEWQIIVALVLAVPVVLVPVVFVWYLNAGGIYTVIRETQKRWAIRRKRIREARLAEESVRE